MNRTAVFITMLVMALAMQGQSRPQSVGLVLSGGGAKGIAHIGVIQALEDNNIPIDYITGTSMGAIVGGLYSAGYTPDEMMQLLESRGFSYWSTGTIDQKLIYYYAQNDPTPELMHVSIGDRDSTQAKSLLPTSLINPLPMNFAFMDLFAAYTAQCGGDFNRLFVPFRCVTSDVYSKHKIVCKDGSLGDAIRASMSFPLVFHPIEMDGVLVYDGGIYDNFPVDVMREEFAPAIMIGVDVSNPDGKPKSNDVLEQLEDMIIQNNDYNLPADEGIRIKIDLQEFGLLDFPKARQIYEIGYRKAMEMMDSIRGRVTSRIPKEARQLRRDVFKSHTPYLRFDSDSVTVTGGTRAQNAYLKYLFTPAHADTFGIERARDAYYRAITPGKLKNLIPQAHYSDTTGLFNLALKATVKDNYRLAFGGYISSSTSSMLFLSGGYNTLSFNSFTTNINAWIGQSYLAGLINARINLRTGTPSWLKLQIAATRQKFYESESLFYEDNLPTFITDTELYSRLIYCMAAGRRGKTELGIGYGHLADKYYANNLTQYTTHSRDKTIQDLGQIYGRYDYNTLNDLSYPTEGAAYRVTAMGVYGCHRYEPFSEEIFHRETRHPAWGQLEASARNFFGIDRHFALGTEFSVLASSRKLLSTYNASIVEAPAFNPTPSSYNAFNPAFRANSFATAGIIPIWKLNETVQLRGTFHAFMPFRKIKERADFTPYYGKWFSDPSFFGEMAAVVTLPFASISAYGTYMSYPARNWSFGLSFGVFILAPKFLR